MLWILLVIILGGADTAITLYDELPDTNPSTEYLHFWNSDYDALRKESTLEDNFDKLFENSDKEFTTVEPDEELNLKVDSGLIDNSTLEDEKRSVVVVVVTNNFNGGRNDESEEPNKIVVPHVSLNGFHKSPKHNLSHFGGTPHLLGSQRPLLIEEDLTTEAPTKTTLQKISSYISNAFSGFGNGKKSEEVNDKDDDLKLSSDAFKKEVPTETLPSEEHEHKNLGHDFASVQSVHNINIVIEEPSGTGDNVRAEDPMQYSINAASSPHQEQPIATVSDSERLKTKGLDENLKGINASVTEVAIESAENSQIQKAVAEVEVKNQLSEVIVTETEELRINTNSTSLLVNSISKTVDNEHDSNYEQPTTNGALKSITAKSEDILHDFNEEVLTNATSSYLDAEDQMKQHIDNDLKTVELNTQEPEVNFKLGDIPLIESNELLKTNSKTTHTENLHNSTFENTNFTQQPYEQRVFISNSNLQNAEIVSNSPVQNTRLQFDENQNVSSRIEHLINGREKVLQIDARVQTESNGYEDLLKVDEQNNAAINSAIEKIPINETEIEATKAIFQNIEVEVTTGKSAASSLENNTSLVIEITNEPLMELSQQLTEEISETSHNVVENKEDLLRANEKQVSNENSIVDPKLISNIGIPAESENMDKNEFRSSSESEELIEEILLSSFSDNETSSLRPLVSEEITDTQKSEKFSLNSTSSVIKGADADIVNSNIAPVFNINSDILEKVEPKVVVNEDSKLEAKIEAVEDIDELVGVDQQNIILKTVEPKVVVNEDSKLEAKIEDVEDIDELVGVDQQNIILKTVEPKVVVNEDSKLQEKIEAVEDIDELVGVDQQNIILKKVEPKAAVNEDSKLQEKTEAVEDIDELVGVDQQNIILEKVETKVAVNEDSKLQEKIEAVEDIDELVGVDQQNIILKKVEPKVVVNENSKLEEKIEAVEDIDELVGVDQQNIILEKVETKAAVNEDSKLQEKIEDVESIDELVGVDKKNIILKKVETKVSVNEDSKLEAKIEAVEDIDELVGVAQQNIILKTVESKVVVNEDSKLEAKIEDVEDIDELVGVDQQNIILKTVEPKVVNEDSKLEAKIEAVEDIDELVGVDQQNIILKTVEPKVVNEDSKLEAKIEAVEDIDELVGVDQKNIIEALEVVEDLSKIDSKARHTDQIEVAVSSDTNKQLILQEISNKDSTEIDIPTILKQEIQEIIAESDDANSAKNDIIYDEIFEEPSTLDEGRDPQHTGNPTQPRIQEGHENDQETIQQKKVSTESKDETIPKTQFDYHLRNVSPGTASAEDAIEKLGLPDEIEELLRKEFEEYSEPINAESNAERSSDLSSTQANSISEYTAKEIVGTSVDIPEDSHLESPQTAFTEVAMPPVFKNDFSEQIIFEDNPEQTAINTLKELDYDSTGIEFGIGGLESQLQEPSSQNKMDDAFRNDTSIEARNEDLVPDLLQPIECVNCGEAEINAASSKNIPADRQEDEVRVDEQVASIQSTQLSENFNNLKKKEEVITDSNGNNFPIGKAHLINESIGDTLKDEENELSEKLNPEATFTEGDSQKTFENQQDHELIIFPNVAVNKNAALIDEKETQLIQNIKFLMTKATNDGVANNVKEDVVDRNGNEENVKLDIISPDNTTVKVDRDQQDISIKKKVPERQSFADSKTFSSDSVNKEISEVITKLNNEGNLVDRNISHLPEVRENSHETVRNEHVPFLEEMRSQIEETDRRTEDVAVETISAQPDEFILSSKTYTNDDENHSSSKLQENVINVEQKHTGETPRGSEERILAIQEETKLFSLEDSSESQTIAQNESNSEEDSREDLSDDNIRNISVESNTEITNNSELNMIEESAKNRNETSSEEDSGEDLSKDSITTSYWSLINQQLKLAIEANPSVELPRHGKKVIGAEQPELDLPISVFQGRSMPSEELYNTPSLFLNPNFIPTKVEFSPAEEISSEVDDLHETGRSISEVTTVVQPSEENLSSTQPIIHLTKQSFDAQVPGKDDVSTISTEKSNEDNEDRPKDNISTSYWALMNEHMKIATEADPTLRQHGKIGSNIEEGQRKLAIIRQPVFEGRSMSSDEIVDPELLSSNLNSTQPKSELNPEEVLPGADNPHVVIKRPAATEVTNINTPSEVTTTALFDEDQPVIVQPESDSTNQFIEAIVEAAELTTELSRFITTFRTPVASDDSLLVPVTEAARTTDNLELVESKLVASAPEESSPASYQHAAVNLAVILITSLVILLLILSLLLLIFVKFRNQQGTLDIQMEEQRSDLEMNTSQS